MKRIVSILLAVLMVVSLFTVVSSARGYTLSIPNTVSAHDLEAYGLHTLNVYSTDVPPTIDGKIDIEKGEYPGPNNGRALSSVPGDNLWMNRFVLSSSGTQTGHEYDNDWTDYIDRSDMPDYINSYLTYDDEYFYFGVTTVIPEIRDTTDTDYVPGAERGRTWYADVMVNFMQSDNIAVSHGASSYAHNRYNLYKYSSTDWEGQQPVASVNISKRTFTVLEDNKFVTTNLAVYVDDLGQSWGPTVYQRNDNFTYTVTFLENGKWGIAFEGRLLLKDVLRITDVEYEDGTPIDYVPEWGAWGFDMRLQAKTAKVSTLPNGTEVKIYPNDVIFAQTYLPTGGAAESADNSKIGEYVFHNTISEAIKSTHGQGSKTCTFLMNPVHFLGAYDDSFNYEGYYTNATETVVSSTSRVTRTRGVLTSGVRGVNNRVVGVATQAAASTGDSLTLTVVLSAVMILCAAAVVVVVMKKRSSRLQ